MDGVGSQDLGRETAPEEFVARVPTYCRICESLCGLVATIRDGSLERLEADPDHPISRGFACAKGLAMAEVQHDPDRVLYPLRRVGAPGEFERVSWEEALSDIVARVDAIRAREGGTAIGWYMGNPAAFAYAHVYWVKGFLDALSSPHYYTPGTQDTNSRFAASALLYGSSVTVPIPDLKRTHFLLVIGANPLLSNGSLLVAPRIRELLISITARGGRVVVVDPRRSETARHFEHVPIRAGTDAWLLLAMMQVIFSEDLVDRAFLDRHTTGSEHLMQLLGPFAPEEAERQTGIPAHTIRSLARAFASAPSAVAYGRTGTCTVEFGTLVGFLVDALNVITGNLDRPGGALFGWAPVSFDDLAHRIGMATYGAVRSRIGDLPDVAGQLPAPVMAAEIRTPGPGQLRALFVSAGNPVLSVPGSRDLEHALAELELLVSMDLYVTETNRHAHYVLPATTFLEREDIPVTNMGFMLTPFAQLTPAVVARSGEAREEWEVIDELARRLRLGGPFGLRSARTLARAGLRITPRRMIDTLIRTSRSGDWFGLRRGGLSMRSISTAPHGMVLREYPPTGVLRRKVRHRRGRIDLSPDAIGDEMRRLRAVASDPQFPLRLIGRRQSRTINSWMHNSTRLTRNLGEPTLLAHPRDAERCGAVTGTRARLVTPSGALVLPVTLTEEMTPGTVSYPHGWGHHGGWRTANAIPGANVNLLAASDPAGLERLAGMAILNGIPARLESVDG